MIHSKSLAVISNCIIPDSARISPFVNLYDCQIGEEAFIGPFVELGGCSIGNRTVVSSHSYVCPGVEIGDDTFVAHSVMFTNDIFTDTPDWTTPKGKRFVLRRTKVGNGVRIGSGAVILPVTIGDGAIIGAGAIVTHDVPAGAIVRGNPARIGGAPSL